MRGRWTGAAPRIMSLKSSASCECASESAHSRRYEAVFEMQPRTNSIEWMI